MTDINPAIDRCTQTRKISEDSENKLRKPFAIKWGEKYETIVSEK